MKRIMVASVLCMLMAGTVEAQTAKHVTSLGLIGTGIALVLTGDDEVDYMPSSLAPSTYDTGNLLPCATMPALDHTGPDFQRTCRIEGGQLTFIDWMRSGPRSFSGRGDSEDLILPDYTSETYTESTLNHLNNSNRRTLGIGLVAAGVVVQYVWRSAPQVRVSRDGFSVRQSIGW